MSDTATPKVDFVRKEIVVLLPTYEDIDYCLKGEHAVKEQKERFLPRPAPLLNTMSKEEKTDNIERYKSYLKRAVFYNAAARTVKGLLGQLYLRDPAMSEEFTGSMDYLNYDIDGMNNGLIEHSKLTSKMVIAHGRSGLWTDYPNVTATGKRATVADNENGTIRATTVLVKAKHFINWRFVKRGAKSVLNLVVFERKYVVEDDGFKLELKKEWVVLRLDEEWKYNVTIYRKGENLEFEQVGETVYPANAKGKNFDEIPFVIAGAEDNDVAPNDPPIMDLVNINFAHYRNSADYEEACFILGQPTPWASELTKDWVENVFNGRVLLGSRAFVPLPKGSQVGLLQAEPNTMVFEAMKHKEQQMKALGAKLVEDRQTQRTATEATQDNVSENSILSTIANNVSEAYRNVLNHHAMFMDLGLVSDDVERFVINTDFDVNNVSPEDRRILLDEYEAGSITWGEYRYKLRQMGIASEDDEEAKEAIDKEAEKKHKNAMELARKSSDPEEEKPAPKEAE